jgi:leader peptidase (prepilin peptidase) / N-methyltransferase
MYFSLISVAILISHLALISWIDFRSHTIPNLANLSLACSGLVVSVVGHDSTPLKTLLAVGLTAAIFLLFGMIYKALRKRLGFGGGDIKFLAAATAWTGLLGVPWMLLIASISGLAFCIFASLHGRAMKAYTRIAFGPHLSLGLLITWLLRDMITGHV